MRVRIASIILVCTALALVIASRLAAEVPNRSVEMLKQTATHIVTAEVLHIYQRSERSGATRYTRYLAEVRVNEVEKGDGVATDAPLYVRYFTKQNPSGVADTAGHRGLPKQGDHVRIYLARNASDGYDRNNNDGGFNVVFPNGFEKIERASGG